MKYIVPEVVVPPYPSVAKLPARSSTTVAARENAPIKAKRTRSAVRERHRSRRIQIPVARTLGIAKQARRSNATEASVDHTTSADINIHSVPPICPPNHPPVFQRSPTPFRGFSIDRVSPVLPVSRLNGIQLSRVVAHTLRHSAERGYRHAQSKNKLRAEHCSGSRTGDRGLSPADRDYPSGLPKIKWGFELRRGIIANMGGSRGTERLGGRGIRGPVTLAVQRVAM